MEILLDSFHFNYKDYDIICEFKGISDIFNISVYKEENDSFYEGICDSCGGVLKGDELNLPNGDDEDAILQIVANCCKCEI